METKMTDAQRFGRIAVIFDQINDLKEKISDLEEERDALSHGVPLGTHAAGKWRVDVTPTKRFDGALAEQVLSTRLFNEICKKTPNASLAKKVLTGEQYTCCQKVSGQKLTVKEIKDLDA